MSEVNFNDILPIPEKYRESMSASECDCCNCILDEDQNSTGIRFCTVLDISPEDIFFGKSCQDCRIKALQLDDEYKAKLQEQQQEKGEGSLRDKALYMDQFRELVGECVSAQTVATRAAVADFIDSAFAKALDYIEQLEGAIIAASACSEALKHGMSHKCTEWESEKLWYGERIAELEEREKQLEDGWRASDDILTQRNEELEKEKDSLHKELKQRKVHAAEYRLKIAELEKKVHSLQAEKEELSSSSAQHPSGAVSCDSECRRLTVRIAELEKLNESWCKLSETNLSVIENLTACIEHTGSTSNILPDGLPEFVDYQLKIAELEKVIKEDKEIYNSLLEQHDHDQERITKLEKRLGEYEKSVTVPRLAFEKFNYTNKKTVTEHKEPQPGDLVVAKMTYSEGFCAGVVKEVDSTKVYLNNASNTHLSKDAIKHITHRVDENGNVVSVRREQ